MKLCSRQLILAVGAATAIWCGGIGLTGHAVAQTPAGKTAAPAPAAGPSAAAAGRPKAGVYFKAVSTSTLKVLSVDDFLQAMGVMAAGLGFDCSDCHPGAGSDQVDWVKDTPNKITARKMTEMVAVINKTNFNGAQRVTCWTCHHGREIPTTTITLAHLYGPPYDEEDDTVSTGAGVTPAAQVLDRYIAAVGGAQKWAAVKSYIATGTASGYAKLGDAGSFTIMAEFPDKRYSSMIYKDHPERGDSTRTYDGKTGWIKTPRALLNEYELEGTELLGARLDAELSFPQEIKTVLTNLRSGFPDSVDGQTADVVQGTAAGNILVRLYFDQKTGLLVKRIRFGNTPIGRSPTELDLGDYRDVGGLKFPFKYSYLWLDGRDSFQLTGVKVNVPVDESKFGKP